MKTVKSSAPTAQEVWKEYESGRDFKTRINLFKNYKLNEDFYVGKQWEGIGFTDLPKPVINVLRRPVNYIISLIVSEDISINLSSYTHDAALDETARTVTADMMQIIERDKVKTKLRELLRNALVDGDMCLYWYYDPAVDTDQAVKGAIKCEIIENINTYFGNPYSPDVQSQPYIILAQRRHLASARQEAKANGVSETELYSIRGDDDNHQNEIQSDAALCTVLIRMWKGEDGKIHFQKSTQTVVIKPETVTEQTLYPVAWTCGERVKSSMHGQALLSNMIPNQIYINKMMAMMMVCTERNAFPKTIYDGTRIKEWDNRIGRDIVSYGPVDNGIFQVIRGGDFSAQALELMRETISQTKETLGLSDTAMGNINNPKNTSAIIATQQASYMPFQLLKLAFYQFIEDCALIMLDLMIAYYGSQHQSVQELKLEDGTVDYRMTEVDYTQIKANKLKLMVDVGAASYFSELIQYQTLENLWMAGIIQDAELFVKNIPDANLRGKKEILEYLREQKQLPQGQGGMPPTTPNGAAATAMPTVAPDINPYAQPANQQAPLTMAEEGDIYG